MCMQLLWAPEIPDKVTEGTSRPTPHNGRSQMPGTAPTKSRLAHRTNSRGQAVYVMN